jgi:hypothetical protein
MNSEDQPLPGAGAPLCMTTLLRAGGCAVTDTTHPTRPGRYYVNGISVTSDFFRTVAAAATRRDTFHSRHNNREGHRILGSHVSFPSCEQQQMAESHV